MHKDIEKILYSEKDIENIVNTIAKQIEKDYNDKDFIMVGLLKGSIAFMVDLMRKVNLDFSIDFIVASSYGSGTVSTGRVNIQKDISQLRILSTQAILLTLSQNISKPRRQNQ